MNNLSTTEKANVIRQTLKKSLGLSARQVSVRAKYFSMGSSIDVIIKDAKVSLKKVKAIAEPAETIHRDEFSGEILSGGNCYLHVRYDYDVLEERAAQYVEAVQNAVNALNADANDNSLHVIEGTSYMVGRNYNGVLSVWEKDKGHVSMVCDAKEIARMLATRIGQ